MKLYLIAIFAISFLSMVYFVSASITIRSGTTCQGGEVCLFSLWNQSNSHVGQCGNYTNYTVCSNEITASTLRPNSCNSNEDSILTLFQPNNTHVAKNTRGFNYSYAICVTPKPYTCGIRTSCLAGQTCAGSVFNITNTHFASCGFYPYQVCCGNDTIAPTISNQTLNMTSINPGAGVRFVANVTDNFDVYSVIATVQYPNGTLANFTMSPLTTGDLYYYDFSDTNVNGNYYWLYTYANDSVGNWASSNPNLLFRTLGINYNIAGSAFDSISGAPMTSGTVTAIVKETGDRGTGTITNGQYSASFATSLNSNQTKFTVGIILNGTGKVGYGQLSLGNGPQAQQIAACSSNLLHFGGTAVDLSGTLISSGNITAIVKSELNTYSNSTSFSNGVWDIYITPCLISGGLYPFNFIITSSDGRVSNVFLNQIAK